jgi:hypothetical protein
VLEDRLTTITDLYSKNIIMDELEQKRYNIMRAREDFEEKTNAFCRPPRRLPVCGNPALWP